MGGLRDSKYNQFWIELFSLVIACTNRQRSDNAWYPNVLLHWILTSYMTLGKCFGEIEETTSSHFPMTNPHDKHLRAMY